MTDVVEAQIMQDEHVPFIFMRKLVRQMSGNIKINLFEITDKKRVGALILLEKFKREKLASTKYHRQRTLFFYCYYGTDGARNPGHSGLMKDHPRQRSI